MQFEYKFWMAFFSTAVPMVVVTTVSALVSITGHDRASWYLFVGGSILMVLGNLTYIIKIKRQARLSTPLKLKDLAQLE